MATWEELEEKVESDKDKEEDILGLVVTTTSDTKSNSDPDAVFNDFVDLTKKGANWYHQGSLHQIKKDVKGLCQIKEQM